MNPISASHKTRKKKMITLNESVDALIKNVYRLFINALQSKSLSAAFRNFMSFRQAKKFLNALDGPLILLNF